MRCATLQRFWLLHVLVAGGGGHILAVLERFFGWGSFYVVGLVSSALRAGSLSGMLKLFLILCRCWSFLIVVQALLPGTHRLVFLVFFVVEQ